MVKRSRRLLRVSQALFAQFIGVSPSSVRSWEQGANRVPGMACRFMDEVNRHPAHWRRRLHESMIDKQMA